jgi:hypothetical protein
MLLVRVAARQQGMAHDRPAPEASDTLGTFSASVDLPDGWEIIETSRD